MFDFTRYSFRTPFHRILWYGLAFQAGAINAGGFLAAGSFVSHVTGIGTMVGIKLADRNLFTVLELLTVPASFLIGAFASALLIERPRANGDKPQYPTVMGIISLFLNIVLICGISGWFGQFGEEPLYYRDIVLVSILSFVCGMQNSAIVSATQGAIRTTHLTGIVTDLGINFVRIKFSRANSEDQEIESLVNWTRLFTFISFSIGSAASAILFSKFEFLGFGIPALTSAVFFAVSLGFAYSRSLRFLNKRMLRSSQYQNRRIYSPGMT